MVKEYNDMEEMLLDESSGIEYKTSKTSLSKTLFDSISAFANTKGGIIYLGIKEVVDKQGNKTYSIEGIDNAQIQEEILSQKLTDSNIISFNPVTAFEIKTTPTGKRFIKIIVSEAPDTKKPVLVAVPKSKTMVAFVRIGSADKIAKDELLTSLIRNQSDDLDVDVLTMYSIDDLDRKTINDYRRKVEENPKFEHYQDFSLNEFLEKIGVVARNRNTGEMGITIGGLLFFGKNTAIIQKFPHFQMDLFDRRSDERWAHRISTFNDDLNAYQFFNQANEYLQNIPLNPFTLDENQQRIEAGNYLKIALREALLNVIMHSDYFSEERDIIDIYWDYFDFSNAGKMKIPIESFFTTNASKSRNPVISKLLKFMGFGELAGTGGEQIFNSARMAKFRYPDIESDSTKTHLRIWTVDFANSLEDISENEKTIVKLLSRSSLSLSKKEIIGATGHSDYETRIAIASLIGKDYIEQIGKARATQYQLKRNAEQKLATLKQEVNDLKIYQENRAKK